MAWKYPVVRKVAKTGNLKDNFYTKATEGMFKWGARNHLGHTKK